MSADAARSALDAIGRLPADKVMSGLVVTVTFASMLLAEAIAPLRRPVEPKLRHTARNLTTGAFSFALLTLLQPLVLLPLFEWVRAERVGLLQMVNWPSSVEAVVGVLLLDYTLWWWHRACHRVSLLWRFHLVHHVDRDLDTSTALRFHFGELALSVFYRAAQIAVIGASFGTVWLWQTILFAAILFHHGNLRLPVALERLLVRLVVTPRMHAIHHSDRRDEADSNWSSILSLWDYLHRTIVLDVPQRDIRIGVPAYRDPSGVTLGKVNALPFVGQKNDWALPDGSPSRRGHGGPSDTLAD